ncbi:MAG: sporulation initiation factor Spo0A C-terminal domain-containing protein [Bacillota bacterium]|jgi:two-component system response regulator (stage 0 sporulation protein A)|nr:sporulation initiation factor Spo0A C-terminal domain-containing protein [Bacillota bacterium]HHU43695.1 hypothetical protein [Clostridiales bacterium]
MDKLNVALADSNTSLLLDAKNFFTEDSEINLIATISDTGELRALNLIDVLIFDLAMSNGMNLEDCFRHFSRRPILVVTIEDGNAFYDGSRYGAECVIKKPFSMEHLRNKLLNLRPASNSIRVRIAENKVLDEKLSNIFIRAGIPPHIKGYQFLREAVKLSVSKPDMINNITKKLYPSIAESFNTTASKVERAIRHAIEVAWNRGKIENINTIFGIKIYAKGEKPTNGELIALIADKLMIECG